MDKSQKYLKWKKTQKSTYYLISLYEILKEGKKHSKRKQISGWPGLKVRSEYQLQRGQENPLEGWNSILNAVPQIHQIVITNIHQMYP